MVPKTNRIISSPLMKSRKGKRKSNDMRLKTIIIIHKLGVRSRSRSDAEYLYAEYTAQVKDKIMGENIKDLKIMNFVVLDGAADGIDISLLYPPTYENVKKEIYPFLDKYKKREFEIFNLLQTI